MSFDNSEKANRFKILFTQKFAGPLEQVKGESGRPIEVESDGPNDLKWMAKLTRRPI